MARPDQDLADLIAANVAGLVVGENVFAGPPREPGPGIPSAAVFCSPSGTGTIGAVLGRGNVDVRRPAVQVFVRGDVGEMSEAEDLAREIRDAIHKQTEVEGYLAFAVREPDPVFVESDDSEHPLFVMNVEVTYAG
jgi:hypothetical protein